jgi:CRISPR-associated endonuclease/helicase Cas3
MEPALAHIGGFGGKAHLLIDHLRDVANDTRTFAEEIRHGDSIFLALAEWVGWLHDLGKYRDQFQEYLKGMRSKSVETQHAVFGAACALDSGLPKAVALAVLGHHAGLHDLSTAQDRISSDELKPVLQVADLLDRLQQDLIGIAKTLPNSCPEFVPLLRGILKAEPRHELLVRMLFSCLVDADYLDTEKYMRGYPRSPLGLEAGSLFSKIDAYVKNLNLESADNRVNSVRKNLYEACVSGAEKEPGFFSVTAPTGSGKTLAMMSFALKHADRHELRRVVVVLPFLSIIEQNASIYRDVLGDKVVLEHHSAIDSGSSSRRYAEEAQVDEAAESESTDQGLGTDKVKLADRLATENWDAPIIVTTAVQFLESLFARKPSRCRKLHNIARSVVLFDEVQSLPLNLLEPILSMLRDLKTDFGCSFLFGSATQPHFGRDVHNLPSGFAEGECREIAPSPKDTFGVLRRTRFELAFRDEAWNWETLIDRIIEKPRILVVVNFRKQAQDLFQQLERREVKGIFHLSSTMCAAHRRAVLGDRRNPEEGTIYHVLQKTKEPCRLISTQVIEAGVDISFPVVFRHIAPFDAILQASGRCNREGELPPDSGRPGGQVVVFKIADEPEGPRGLYREATSITRSRLGNWSGDPDDLPADPSAFGDYHDSLIRWGNTDQKDIQDLRRLFSFEAVARHFKVIDEAGTAVIVPFGAAVTIIEQIRKCGIATYEDRRRLQRYTVNLFPNWISALGRDLEPLAPGGEILSCHQARYHNALGFNLGELPIERFAFFENETA